MTNIHSGQGWPRLVWNDEQLASQLAATSRRQGRLIGQMEGLELPLRKEASLQVLTEDVIRSSEIEGVILDKDQVRLSIARRLGTHAGGPVPTDRRIEGVAEMALDATQDYQRPLTAERLCRWHAALLEAERSDLRRINRDHVNCQEIAAFLDWFESSTVDPVIKAGVAHFWFATRQAFDDGNGRIARAIADLALCRAEGSAERFYSMSAEVRANRNAYYGILEKTRKGGLDITNWLSWFLACLSHAIDGADGILASVLRKARFWKAIGGQSLNERQRKVLARLPDGLEGKLTNASWAKLCGTSSDTALRDIKDLLERKILMRLPGGGRSTNYAIAPELLSQGLQRGPGL